MIEQQRPFERPQLHRLLDPPERAAMDQLAHLDPVQCLDRRGARAFAVATRGRLDGNLRRTCAVANKTSLRYECTVMCKIAVSLKQSYKQRPREPVEYKVHLHQTKTTAAHMESGQENPHEGHKQKTLPVCDAGDDKSPTWLRYVSLNFPISPIQKTHSNWFYAPDKHDLPTAKATEYLSAHRPHTRATFDRTTFAVELLSYPLPAKQLQTRPPNWLASLKQGQTPQGNLIQQSKGHRGSRIARGTSWRHRQYPADPFEVVKVAMRTHERTHHFNRRSVYQSRNRRGQLGDHL